MNKNGNKPINSIEGRLGEHGIGLTKREYFAGLAFSGLLACPNLIFTNEEFARESVRLADELLKALEK